MGITQGEKFVSAVFLQLWQEGSAILDCLSKLGTGVTKKWMVVFSNLQELGVLT
jgi:hypothetical protein